MKTIKLFLSMLFASIIGGAIALFSYQFFIENTQNQSLEEKQEVVLSTKFDSQGNGEVASSSNTSITSKNSSYIVPDGLNFIDAASKVTPAVVHIKTTYTGQSTSMGNSEFEDMFREFFGDRGRGGRGGGPRMSSGSGVIITDDGYIATNNHVVEGASYVEVVLDDKRSFEAKIIGTDVTTDLALLKIEGENHPFVPFGNSEDVQIGQWVLAVGNPFDLTSTVTAGIVSAVARNINILRENSQYAIESFIQTDAAVNPGNSGGALVDLNGNLIGINTAIATTTGSYSGYSFAVPVTLVKKVMDDLLSYGQVQRALLGINIRDVDAQLAKAENLDEVAGVYIANVQPNSGAEDAGLIAGDVILEVEGNKVNSTSRLQELVALNRPGDEISVKIKRDGDIENVLVTLKNKRQTTELIAKEDNPEMFNDRLGAELSELSFDELEKLKINSGIKVVKLKEGKLKAANVEEGFIITEIDEKPISKPQDVEEIIASIGEDEGVLIKGVYPDGEKAFYGIGF